MQFNKLGCNDNDCLQVQELENYERIYRESTNNLEALREELEKVKCELAKSMAQVEALNIEACIISYF